MKIKRVSKKMLSSNLRASDIRKIIRWQISTKGINKNDTIMQIATRGLTSKQKTKLRKVLKQKGFAEYRKQSKRFRQSNKANLVKAILRTKYGVKYAERQYRQILKATTGEDKQKLTKAENRARAKAYLNKLRAREYNARSAQAKEAIRLQRQFMKEKFNAIINAGLSLNLTTSTRHGIAIEEYIDKYFYMKIQEAMERYQEQLDNEEIDAIPPEQDIYNEVWLELTGSGEVVPLKQGEQYGYYDPEHDEVISPV